MSFVDLWALAIEYKIPIIGYNSVKFPNGERMMRFYQSPNNIYSFIRISFPKKDGVIESNYRMLVNKKNDSTKIDVDGMRRTLMPENETALSVTDTTFESYIAKPDY